MKMTFKNIVIHYGGCGCCGDEGVYDMQPGPFVIETTSTEVSVAEHAKIAFGDVVSYDCEVEN